MRLIPAALTISCLTLLSACSYPPQLPGLLVSTLPPGAACTVVRLGQPVASVYPTPGIAHVEPEDGGLTVSCRRQGFADATLPVAPLPPPPPGAPVAYATVSPHRIDIALVPAPPGSWR